MIEFGLRITHVEIEPLGSLHLKIGKHGNRFVQQLFFLIAENARQASGIDGIEQDAVA